MNLPRSFCFAILCILILPGIAGIGVAAEMNESKNAATQDFSWTSIPLTDAKTGETFTIQDLIHKGKPVLIHTFAVWCPACTLQLGQTTKLVSDNPDAYTVLGLDTDPNENSGMVRDHVNKNGFSGTFAIAPKELTQGLVKTFGTGITLSAPHTITISHNKVRHLGDGVFNADKLLEILPPEQ